MGQTLHRVSAALEQVEQHALQHRTRSRGTAKYYRDKFVNQKFPDLSELPPELSMTILSHLNATDLCLAACVWDFAQDEVLWHDLCKNQWPYVSVYKHACLPYVSFRQLYLKLDEGTLTFNGDAFQGMEYFFKNDLVHDDPDEIAQFLHHSRGLNHGEVRRYLECRREVLDPLIQLHNYKNQFLPNALRKFFRVIQAPNDRGDYLQALLEKFSRRYCQCNPHLGLQTDTIYIICFSLILLSVDLSSPHVKNKMSKREFIRNVRNAVHFMDDDMYGHLYDDIYLRGHIVSNVERY